MAYLETDAPINFGGNNGGFGGGFSDGWWGIILIALLFGWGRNGNGFGGGNGGAFDNYVLGSDFSMLSRQLSDGFNSQERKLDSISNGICSLGYDQLAQMNGINTNIMNSAFGLQTAINGIGTQLADCCCLTQRSIDGINYNMAKNTCDIIQAGHNDTQRIVDLINANTLEAKNQKIQDQQATINALQLRASQEAQNNYLIGALRPTPSPAYVVPNPYCCNNVYGACNGTTAL